MIYWQPNDPGEPANIKNESVARAIDRVAVDARSTYLASGRRINNPAGSFGHLRATDADVEDAYLFGRVRIPPGTVALRVWMRYAGAGPLVEIDGQAAPTFAACQQIRLPKQGGTTDPVAAAWVTTAPYLGTTTPPPEGNHDCVTIPDLTLPARVWQDAFVRITIPTVNPPLAAPTDWYRLTTIQHWWIECLMAENVAI